MHTSLKLKTCSRFFIAFLKSTLNLEHFEKNDQSYSLSITEIINCETGSYLNVQKAIFHTTLRQTTCYRVQKHYWDQHGTSFIPHSHKFEKEGVGKGWS